MQDFKEVNWKGKILLIMFFPLYIIGEGLSNLLLRGNQNLKQHPYI